MNIIDMHCHVLPGIDDGAGDWERTLDMLRIAAEAGVVAVIATPHWLPFAQSAPAEQVKQLCKEAEKKAKEKLGTSMRIFPGMELYYHTGLVEELESGKALTLAESRYVLVEFDPGAPFSQLLEAAEKLRRSSYNMVLAHCERYEALRDERHFRELQGKSVLFQSNVHVMSRGMLDARRRWLQKRLKHGDISFLSSDMHNLSSRPPFTNEALMWYKKHLGSTYLEALISGNVRSSILAPAQQSPESP